MKAGCTHKDTMQQQRHYPFSDGHPPFTADKTTPNTAAIHNFDYKLAPKWMILINSSRNRTVELGVGIEF